MTTAVWDASALLLILLREPGWEAWVAELRGGSISSVNLAEVATKLLDAGGTVEETRQILNALPLSIHDFTPELAYRAAEFRRPTRSLGLSLGDRACLALGSSLAVPVLTADRDWHRLDLEIEIVLVRGESDQVSTAESTGESGGERAPSTGC